MRAGGGRDMAEPPLRVAHFLSSLGIYGAERWTLTLFKHLRKGWIDPIAITVGVKPGADAFYEMMLAEGFQAVHLGLPGRLNPRAVYALRRLVCEQHIAILHTHGFKSDLMGYLATRGLPVRLVSTPHGWCASEGWLIRAYEALGRLFLRGFDRLYPLSPALLETLQQQRFKASQLRLMLNAVDETAFDACFAQRQPRGADDPMVFLFVGRLERPKGIFDLVEAFGQATFNVPAELHVAGEGPAREELEARCEQLRIADQVRFMGFVPDVRPLLAASHVLVLPSYSEGIPRVVMEAFAAGVPVIGTQISGVEQLVDHETTGLLTPVGDAVALARAMERMTAQPEMAWNMATRARHCVATVYSASRHAREFEDEYWQLAGGPGATMP